MHILFVLLLTHIPVEKPYMIFQTELQVIHDVTCARNRACQHIVYALLREHPDALLYSLDYPEIDTVYLYFNGPNNGRLVEVWIGTDNKEHFIEKTKDFYAAYAFGLKIFIHIREQLDTLSKILREINNVHRE